MKRVDAALALALALAMILVAWPTLQPFGPTLRNDIERGMVYSSDEAIFLYSADQVSRGQVPYRDHFQFKGPIGFLPVALAFTVAGPGLLSGRIATFVLMAIFTALLFGVARRLGAGRALSTGIALLVPFVVWPCWPYAYHDWTGQLLLLGAAWFALGAVEDRARDWLWCGVFASLATWTTLAQGLVGAVVLPAAGVILALEEKRSWRPILARFAVGFFAVTILVFGGLALCGALPQALDAMFVFTFKVYPTANKTPYAFDLPSRISRWNAAPLSFRAALRLVVYAVAALPLLALALGLAVAGWRVFALLRRRAIAPSPSSRALLIAAAMAAPFVPIALSRTRADICHIGFVLATTLLPLFALPRARKAIGAGVAILVAAGATVWTHNLTAKFERLPLAAVEPRVATLWQADIVAAMTAPGDKVYCPPIAGLQNLLSRRDNATAFNLLQSTSYSVAHWPIAAAQVVERKPRLICAMYKNYYDRLTSLRPEIKQLYKGFDHLYVLRGRAGPSLPLPATFVGTLGARGMTLSLDAESAHIDGGQPLPAIVDGDVITVMAGSVTWVARLSPNGKTLRGEVFPLHQKLELVRSD